MAENEICGTKDPTFHRVLLDTRFELPLGILDLVFYCFLQYCICSTLVPSYTFCTSRYTRGGSSILGQEIGAAQCHEGPRCESPNSALVLLCLQSSPEPKGRTGINMSLSKKCQNKDQNKAFFKFAL